MHCNGKCKLYQELKKAADEEAENNKLPLSVLKLKTLDTFIEMNAAWQPNVVAISESKNIFSRYLSSLLNGYSNALFKPPQQST